MTQIVLIGFMGAGKTAIGKQLAKQLQLPLLDTDRLIEEKLGLSIPMIFATQGEGSFRTQETEILKEIQTQAGIISTGGGIVLNEASQAILSLFPNVIFLDVKLDTLIERIKQDTENVRPLFLNHSTEQFREIYYSRMPFYQKASTLMIESQDKSVEEIANEIILKVGV